MSTGTMTGRPPEATQTAPWYIPGGVPVGTEKVTSNVAEPSAGTVSPVEASAFVQAQFAFA